MKKGLYRTSMPSLGECARVHDAAGDAAPFLSRDIYELLEFEPKFEALPPMVEFEISDPHKLRGSGSGDRNLARHFGFR